MKQHGANNALSSTRRKRFLSRMHQDSFWPGLQPGAPMHGAAWVSKLTFARRCPHFAVLLPLCPRSRHSIADTDLKSATSSRRFRRASGGNVRRGPIIALGVLGAVPDRDGRCTSVSWRWRVDSDGVRDPANRTCDQIHLSGRQFRCRFSLSIESHLPPHQAPPIPHPPTRA